MWELPPSLNLKRKFLQGHVLMELLCILWLAALLVHLLIRSLDFKKIWNSSFKVKAWYRVWSPNKNTFDIQNVNFQTVKENTRETASSGGILWNDWNFRYEMHFRNGTRNVKIHQSANGSFIAMKILICDISQHICGLY